MNPDHTALNSSALESRFYHGGKYFEPREQSDLGTKTYKQMRVQTIKATGGKRVNLTC